MLATNLKHLRKQKGISQQVLADALGIARATIAGYETGKAEPNINALQSMAAYFRVSLDALLSYDLRKGQFERAVSSDFRVLAISVDSEQRENIELVSTKAAAGYGEQFNDPEFISSLPKLQIPGLDEGTYRAFVVEGESMLPIQPGSIVVCRYLESTANIKNGATYVIVTKNGDVVYKRVHRDPLGILAVSDNPGYTPYVIASNDIQEIWEFRALVAFSDSVNADQPILSRLDRILEKVEDLG